MSPTRRVRAQPSRVLVAVHDSPASLRAARLAVAVAATARCPLLVVTVVPDGHVHRALEGLSIEPDSEVRQHTAAQSVLRHVDHLARAAGVDVELRELATHPGEGVLAAALDWGADLLVVGRNESTEHTPGRVGDVALYVLELSAVPVLVVP
jgi:nucleotide-binding universal stress UspA family protein